MAGLVWEARPQLRRPVLVAGFEGWNDAASAASRAAGWLTERFGATKMASIDPEDHFDFQSVRPTVELVNGLTRSLKWPANEFFAVPVDLRDLVVLRGVEPNLRWPAFCREVLDVADESRCEMVVTLGALLADVPHTRPVRVTGATTDPELMARLGLQRSRYEGPTGIVGVLHDTARAAGVVSASLWAPVPHYVSTPPNPMATRALLDRLGQLLGTAFALGELDEQAGAWRTRVDEVVSQDEDVRTYVGQLEERYDAEAETDVPSGETLAAEVEQFLRDRRDDD
jgi:proteasome assembly chaperone (PAC2) family protein